jgi:3-hydroxybutyryl-CoA dehydratase
MAKIKIEEIEVGMSRSYSQTITDADIKTFAGFSGDNNPIHVNDVYAERSRFKRRIAHGMLSASFLSALFGKELPGEGSVYMNQSLKFENPVYVNDTVTATITVTEVDIERRRVYFDTDVFTRCPTDPYTAWDLHPKAGPGQQIAISGKAEIYVLKD